MEKYYNISNRSIDKMIYNEYTKEAIERLLIGVHKERFEIR